MDTKTLRITAQGRSIKADNENAFGSCRSASCFSVGGCVSDSVGVSGVGARRADLEALAANFGSRVSHNLEMRVCLSPLKALCLEDPDC